MVIYTLRKQDPAEAPPYTDGEKQDLIWEH